MYICELNTNVCDYAIRLHNRCVDLSMGKKIHPITGFEVLVESDNRNSIDIKIEPLTSKRIREIVGKQHNMSVYWYNALRNA